ncbi:GNAT family N-acetyltransferase [Desulfovibrio sp. OttesenSCG-928-G15]|nr:GNAT family N-acetyltransferase [Desulfovibrio sp. OttesenSCG-928-G15]
MQKIRISDAQSPWFDRAWDIYTASFPRDEIRSRAEQARLYAKPDYRMDAWVEEDRLVGFLAWWNFDDARYIEHLAINPDCRSGGYGSRILQAWLAEDERPVYLEIEKPVDERTKRRLGFYSRLGFLLSPMTHIQPPYNRQGPGVALTVLSWPAAISWDRYEILLQNLHSHVWADIKA